MEEIFKLLKETSGREVAAAEIPADVSTPMAEAEESTPDEPDDPDKSPEEEVRIDDVLTVHS